MLLCCYFRLFCTACPLQVPWILKNWFLLFWMPMPMHFYLSSSHTSLFWTSFFCGHSSQRCYRLITPANTSSFVSGRSGKLHPWLAHLASMLRNCLMLSRKHPDLFAYSVLPSQHMSQRFKSLIRTKACDLEAPCHCLKKSVLLFTLCGWLVMKFHHDVSFTDLSPDPGWHISVSFSTSL